MLALFIVIGSLVYLFLSMTLARHLTGIWKYKDWYDNHGRYPKRSYMYEPYEGYDYGIGGEWFGALILSIVAMPIIALYVYYSNKGDSFGFSIDPKHVRDARLLRAQEEKLALQAKRIKELEDTVGVS